MQKKITGSNKRPFVLSLTLQNDTPECPFGWVEQIGGACFWHFPGVASLFLWESVEGCSEWIQLLVPHAPFGQAKSFGLLAFSDHAF